MLFAIMAQDVEKSLQARLEVRPAHLERLNQLQDQGRLILAGPHPHETDEGFTGSLIVASFDDLEAAKQWAAADPFVQAGVYAKVKVKPFKQVFPTQE